MKKLLIIQLLMICASSIVYANNPVEELTPKKPIAATVGLTGSIQGYWGMCGDVVACLDHPTSRCVEIVIKPKPSYQLKPCSQLIQETYTDPNLIDAVELHVFDNSGAATIHQISAYSTPSVCEGKGLEYTPGIWTGVYSGQIQINTCIIQ